MKNIVFFIIAFFYTGFVYSQDSAERKAVAQQSHVVNTTETNDSDKSKLNQSTRNAVSVNSTDTIPHQTSGDFNDKKRITISEDSNKDEPK